MDLNCLQAGLDHPQSNGAAQVAVASEDDAVKQVAEAHSPMVQALQDSLHIGSGHDPKAADATPESLESSRPAEVNTAPKTEGHEDAKGFVLQVQGSEAVPSIHEASPEAPAESRTTSDFEARCGIEERIQILKSCVAFTARMVDDRCIKQFASKLRPRSVEAGTVLCRRGDAGDPMYFIASGSCVCSLNGRELERLGKGQSFGEVSFINQCKLRKRGMEPAEAKAQCLRGADIAAEERCELLALHCDDAWPLIKLSPNLWFTLDGIAQRRSLKVEKNL